MKKSIAHNIFSLQNIYIAVCLLLSGNLLAQSDGWESVNIKTGDVPSCYSFNPKFDFKLDNFLRVKVGGNADIALKLVDYFTDKCIRYVYISYGSTYEISNIPEGKYYLKLAFGKDWSINKSNNYCDAKFYDSESYQKGEDILDYFLKRDTYGTQVPSYELLLEIRVQKKKKGNIFDSQEISEEEFLK